MNRPDWPVLHEGIRPAGKPDRCFYCDAKLGGQHKPDCVIRQRTVVVRATVEYTIDVPENWSPHDVESHRNESSLCSGSRLVEELNEVYADDDNPDEPDEGRRNCLCGRVKWEFVREADAEDEERDGLRVAELPS